VIFGYLMFSLGSRMSTRQLFLMSNNRSFGDTNVLDTCIQADRLEEKQENVFSTKNEEVGSLKMSLSDIGSIRSHDA
jgi:hypothetical protein